MSHERKTRAVAVMGANLVIPPCFWITVLGLGALHFALADDFPCSFAFFS